MHSGWAGAGPPARAGPWSTPAEPEGCERTTFARSAVTGPSHPLPAEFSKIAQATSVGFAIMGFIGFFVKLIFIPINNIIVGSS